MKLESNNLLIQLATDSLKAARAKGGQDLFRDLTPDALANLIGSAQKIYPEGVKFLDVPTLADTLANAAKAKLEPTDAIEAFCASHSSTLEMN